MGRKARNASSTKEERENTRKLYQALMQEGDIPPDINPFYGPYVNYVFAARMYNARANGGVPGLQAYIDKLSAEGGPSIKPLLKIMLKPEPENDAGTLLSDVQPQKMPWLWYPRLALGKITMLDGDPGLGKSLIGADIGARVTRGEKMPDGSPCLAMGGVVVIMPEDTLEDTILPRFARAGADLSKVVDLSTVKADGDEDEDEHGYTYEGVRAYGDKKETVYTSKIDDVGDEGDVYTDEIDAENREEEVRTVENENTRGDKEEGFRRPFQLQRDLDHLEAAIRRVDAKLVFIDPILALAGGANMYKDDDVRTLLLPLKLLIEKLQVACILVRHMTKTRGENPLMAGNGSIAFIGLARTGLIVMQHPEDKSQMILSHIKSNIGPLASAITYTIGSDEGDDRPYIVWGNEIQTSALDLIAAPRKSARK